MSVQPDSGMVEADFSVFREDFSRYLLEDGTTLRVKLVIRKVFKTPTMSPQGYPVQMGFDSVNIVSAQVPERLKRKPSPGTIDLSREVGKETKFELMGEQRWQEYLTSDGLRILVKPVVTKVIRYDMYNNFGEPIYNAFMQSITNVEKISGN
jgi:hypothetical protein